MRLPAARLVPLVCALALLWLPALLDAQTTSSAAPDPTDAGVVVPAVRYDSAFTGYVTLPSTRLWPWTRIFSDDGSTFTDRAELDALAQAVVVRKPQGGHGSHGDHGSGRSVTIAGGHAAHTVPRSAPADLPDGVDATGIVEAIDIEGLEVELRHGPIEKLDMGAMTMWFSVRDAALLEGVSVGDHVGFAIEVGDRGTVITAFVRLEPRP